MSADRLLQLALSGQFCDMTVRCTGGVPEKVPMSKLFLAAVCPKLQATLAAPTSEIELPVSADALRAALALGFGLPGAVRTLPSQADLRTAAVVLGMPEVFQSSFKARAVESEKGPARLLGVGSLALAAGAWYAWAPVRSYRIYNNGFFMDDAMIARNPNVFEDLDWQRLFRTDYWGLDMFAGTWTHKSFRPLTVLTFRWNYVLHGFESSGFHLANLALHVLCSCLLAIFGLQAGLERSWALLLSALFLVHPVHTESVLYVVGRADLLCLALLLLAALVHGSCRTQRRMFLGVALSSALLLSAGLCKETGFCFFGLLVGWDVLQLLTQPRSNAFGLGCRILLLLVVGASSCVLRVWYTSGTAIERMDPHSNPVAVEKDPVVRALSYALIHGIYGKLLAWPSFLCYDYSFDAVPLVRSLWDCRLQLTLSSYLAFMALLTLSLGSLRQRAARVHEIPVIGMAVFILSFLPMSNILFPVGTTVAERLLYIPSAGFLLAVVGLARLRPVHSAIFLLAAGAIFVPLTAQRVVEWSSPEAITVADAARQLRSTRVQYNLATHYLSAKRYDDALSSFERVMTIDPTGTDCMPLYHAGQIHIYQGNHARAEQLLEKAVVGHFSPLLVNEEEVFHDYGLALWFAQKPQEAITNFEKSLAINATFTKGRELPQAPRRSLELNALRGSLELNGFTWKTSFGTELIHWSSSESQPPGAGDILKPWLDASRLSARPQQPGLRPGPGRGAEPTAARLSGRRDPAAAAGGAAQQGRLGALLAAPRPFFFFFGGGLEEEMAGAPRGNPLHSRPLEGH